MIYCSDRISLISFQPRDQAEIEAMPSAKRAKLTTTRQFRQWPAERRDFFRRLSWDIDPINVHLCELPWHTASELGITGHNG